MRRPVIAIAAVVLVAAGFAAGWAAGRHPNPPKVAATPDSGPEAAVCTLALGISRYSQSPWDDETALEGADVMRTASGMAPEGPIRKAGLALATGIPNWMKEPDEGIDKIAHGVSVLQYACEQRFARPAFTAAFPPA